MPQPVLDFVGREITGGSTVIYPVRKGSSMWLNRCTVTKIEEGVQPVILGVLSNGHVVRVKNLQNVVVVSPGRDVTAA